MAAVCKDDKWGFIDAQYNFIVKPIYEAVEPFKDNYAKIKVGQYYGVINKSGKEIIKPQYQDIVQGSETSLVADGLILVKSAEGYGFINERGKTIIPCHYHDANVFFEGLAAVRRDKLWGFINSQGHMIIFQPIKQTIISN